MAHRSSAAIATIFLLATPVAVAAASAVPVPQPADFALFAAGVLGLLIGRRGSRVRRRD